VISIDFELALVGLTAMLEPATLLSSVLALVIGDRPLRTGSLFYVGGLGVTLLIGVIAALVVGNVAASPTSTPKTRVSVLLMAPGFIGTRLVTARGWVERHARTIIAVVLLGLAASLHRDGIAELTGA
jgi:hypothetical protein